MRLQTSKLFIILLLSFFMTCDLLTQNSFSSQFLTHQDILKIPFSNAPHRLHYGNDNNQFGDLRIPNQDGPYPLLVVIHGGCWTSKIANKDFMSSFAEAFTLKGIATWNIEYRCIDNDGGWPETFLDVGRAIDYLRNIAPKYNLDINNIVIIGHSAGGHLALWSGARHKIDSKSDLYIKNPITPKAVVNIAGPGDLRLFLDLQEKACGTNVINKLLGDSPKTFDERLTQASPYELLPLKIKQLLITGEFDKAAPVDSMEHYLNKAKELDEEVNLIVIKDAAHFEVIDHRTEAWSQIRNAVIDLFDYEQ
jgi:acetyl esterase/lipase